MNEHCDCPPYDCSALVARCLTGDRFAGEELVGKFQPLVWGIVTRVLGPERSSEWEDASQAVFLRLLEGGLKTWKQRCPFCQWLAVVAARRAIDFQRRRHPIELSKPNELPAPVPLPAPLEPEEIERIREKVAGFPTNWREVWEMHLRGVDHKQIARTVGKALRTIQNWLAEMRDQLRQCLKD